MLLVDKTLGRSSISQGCYSSSPQVMCIKARRGLCGIQEGSDLGLSEAQDHSCQRRHGLTVGPALASKDHVQNIVCHPLTGRKLSWDPSCKSVMLQRNESGFKSASAFLRSPILSKETKQHTNTHAVIKRINTGLNCVANQDSC